ncbi:MAG TPA: radical SAM protein [Geobacteraceae bacterium]
MTMPRKTFTLQLTERCNLACTYCYVRARETVEPDCTPELCRTFVDFALREAAEEVEIAFFGGEPLLRPDLIRATVNYGKQAAADSGATVRFHIVTNGTLLDDEIGDFIARERIVLEVSIDGPREIHDAHRPRQDGSGSFAAVYGNLRRFRDRHPDHAIRIFSVITGTDSLPWLHELLAELDTTAFTFNEVTLPAAQEECGSIRAAAGPALAGRIARHRERFLQGDAHADAGVNRQLAFYLKGTATRGCGAGVTATVVTQAGAIYPCPFFIGHEDQIIGDIFTGMYPEKVQPYRERTADALEPCRECPLHSFCGGGCAFRAYRQSGSIRTACTDSCRTIGEVAGELEKSVIALAAGQPELFCRTLDLATDDPCLHIPERLDAGARNFIVRLTGECNLACDYCYDRQGDGHGPMDLATARSVAGHIVRSPGREPLISLFGGEPLLNWETGRFLIEAVAAGAATTGKRPFFHITTNGTLITEEIARTFARHDVTVQISIDGPRTGHDAHRRFPDGSGSHASVVEKLALLRSVHPRAKIDAQVVLTPGNTDMVRIVGELTKQGFRRINFLRCAWGERVAVSWTAGAIAELARARAAFFPFYLDAVRHGRPEIDLNFAALVAAEPGGSAGLCECGSTELYIDTSGDIYPCPQVYTPGEHRLGSCTASEPAPVAMPPVTLDRIDADCFKCWAFSRCRGGCAVLCQRCPLVPTTLPPEQRKPWCDLMRAEFARAIIAHRFLERYHPESLAVLKSIFTGLAHA